ncbi:MAG: ABC transporter permease, partial [Pseudomonadales bacterium]|nr:ABC transporter permease [Pseudomonadales bacterium]
LVYLAAQGYLNLMWLWLPVIILLQFLFTMGLVAILSALCVFLRDLQQLVSLVVITWFFLTPIIYPITLIQNESARELFLFNPMYSFVNLYREIILIGEFSIVHFQIILPVALISYLIGGWLFIRIKHAFGDVL